MRGLPDDRKRAIKLAVEVASSEEQEQFYVEHRYHGYLIGPGGRCECDCGCHCVCSCFLGVCLRLIFMCPNTVSISCLET